MTSDGVRDHLMSESFRVAGSLQEPGIVLHNLHLFVRFLTPPRGFLPLPRPPRPTAFSLAPPRRQKFTPCASLVQPNPLFLPLERKLLRNVFPISKFNSFFVDSILFSCDESCYLGVCCCSAFRCGALSMGWGTRGICCQVRRLYFSSPFQTQHENLTHCAMLGLCPRSS